MGFLVEASNIVKIFGKVAALQGFTLSIPDGSFGIIGPNGAGKTTFLKIITGLIRPSSGDVKVFGMSPFGDGLEARKRIGVVLENPSFQGNLTPFQHLRFAGKLRGLSEKKARREALRFLKLVGLNEWSDTKVEGFSRGMKQRLAIAFATVGSPSLLVMDEPTAHLDPIGRIEILRILESIKTELHFNLIISTHLLDDIERLCDACAIVDRGQLVESDTMSNILKRVEVMAYEAKTTGPKELAALLEELGASDIKTLSNSVRFALKNTRTHWEEIPIRARERGINLLSISPDVGILASFLRSATAHHDLRRKEARQ